MALTTPGVALICITPHHGVDLDLIPILKTALCCNLWYQKPYEFLAVFHPEVSYGSHTESLDCTTGNRNEFPQLCFIRKSHAEAVPKALTAQQEIRQGRKKTPRRSCASPNPSRRPQKTKQSHGKFRQLFEECKNSLENSSRTSSIPCLGK